MRIVAGVIFVMCILPFSYAIIRAIEEVRWKKFQKMIFNILWLLTTAAIIGLFSLLPKCSSSEEIAPNGQTMMEHYEPRF
ncbi:hypothetical protein [Muribaculum intestinale]|uniref:hypothetical protein n=1 Tax=Muribaculum intestinale TaxID=1796646 RepID=UPI00242AD31F|nr:hypothetical protein [Muribaculum intestinale]